MLRFYTPWKRLKTFGFWTFLWGIEMEHRAKFGLIMILSVKKLSCWKFILL